MPSATGKRKPGKTPRLCLRSALSIQSCPSFPLMRREPGVKVPDPFTEPHPRRTREIGHRLISLSTTRPVHLKEKWCDFSSGDVRPCPYSAQHASVALAVQRRLNFRPASCGVNPRRGPCGSLSPARKLPRETWLSWTLSFPAPSLRGGSEPREGTRRSGCSQSKCVVR